MENLTSIRKRDISLSSSQEIDPQTQINQVHPEPVIPSEFRFESRYIEIAGNNIHYLEEGIGDPVLFIHGCPTSSYLWRNIIPFVSTSHRTVAFDLIGMGKSDKPEKKQDFSQNYMILEQFIQSLKLENITLVLHDWGAALGFEYARNHPNNVKAISFMEGVLPPKFPQSSFASMGAEVGDLFKAFRDPVQGQELLIKQNYFIENTLPCFVNRTLDEIAWENYRRPFLKEEERTALLVWPSELPIEGEPVRNIELMSKIELFMQNSKHPMLLLYSDPGTLIPPENVPWYQSRIKNLDTIFVGQGTHFIQEDEPALIGESISAWLQALNK